MWGIIILVVAGIFLYVFLEESNKKYGKNKMERQLESIPEFTATHKFMGCDGRSGIAIDETKEQVCLLTCKDGMASCKIISSLDILSVEIFEDAESLHKTVRSSQIASAAIGGILLGGAGAIVGGLSGKTKVENKVKYINLQLIVNDTNTPLHDISFLESEDKKGGAFYTQAINNIRQWNGLLEVFLRRANTVDRKKLDSSNLQPLSVAEEIKKLASLYESGYLTPEEFNKQKRALLSTTEKE